MQATARPLVRIIARLVLAAGLGAALLAPVAARPPAPPLAWSASATRPAPVLRRSTPDGAPARVFGVLAERLPGLAPAARARLGASILAEAGRAGLDPLLVLALIEVESSFDPGAVSSAGAIGLMQLLEDTMRAEVARSGLGSADARDPAANVEAGVRYLHRLVGAFNGSLDLALMAYNAGPNQLLAWLQQGDIPEGVQGYPRRVRAELDRLRRRSALAAVPVPAARETASRLVALGG